ncbi:MAG: sulfite exporter TauE/SafE family protein [Acidobacteria bacterium]|nr:sulfite exporter TauE/SafE family protein [Acidobacteriota bacterium]
MSDDVVNNAAVVVAGLGIGVVFGLFGAGGSAFATPVLALLGLPPVAAVATPLPAMLPASLAGARRYLRDGSLDRRLVGQVVAGGVPGAVIGGLASSLVDGNLLLQLSAALLLVIGARLLLPDGEGRAERCAARRASPELVVGASAAVGVVSGLLANGGGFLLVPLFVLFLGLSAREATATSTAAVGALTIHALATHWGLGHIDWPVAAVFTVGVMPGSLLGALAAKRVHGASIRRAFAVILVGFALWFFARQA